MTERAKADRILRYETLGCAAIVAVILAAEFVSLDGQAEILTEIGVVAVGWLAGFFLTRRLLQRLYYLEGFLRVCSWCRNIDHDGEWIPIEQYFSKSFNIKPSHAICPECQAKLPSSESRPS